MSETEKAEAPAPKPRPKMTLPDQSAFLINLLRRCEMHDEKRNKVFAGECLLALKREDMIALEVIQQTLAVFELHGADDLVRRKIWNDRNGRRG